MQGARWSRARRCETRGTTQVSLHNVHYAPFNVALAWLLALALTAALAISPAAGNAPPASAVRWGYLPNGLGYLVIANHAAPLVGSTAIVHAGSGVETPRTQGASHFLEHLLFNGTESMTQEALYAAFDRMGVYHNATTRPTHMAHFVLSPTESFWSALRLQQSMVFHSALSAEKIEKERGIILEELAKDRDAGAYDLEQILLTDQFGPNGYGLATLGTTQSIQNLSRSEIQEFYARYYAPGNISWILIGDVDPDAAVDSLGVTVGREIARDYPANLHPVFDLSGPMLRAHDVPAESPVIQLAWIGPSPDAVGFPAFRAAAEIGIAGESSPFGSRVRAALGTRLTDYGFELAEYPGLSILRVRLELAPGSSPDSPLALVRSIPGGSPLPAAAELDVTTWRTRQEADEEYLREKPHYYGILRGEAMAARGLPSMAAALDEVAGVDLAEVHAAENPLLRAPDRISVIRPTPEETPEATPAAPRMTESWTLSNGVKVVVLSSPESGVFALHGFVRDRVRRELRPGAAELLHLLLATGPSDLSEEEFGHQLDRIGAEWKTADDPRIPYDDFYSVPEWSFLRFQTLDRSAEDGLALVARTLRAPRVTDAEFQRARQSLLDRAEKARKSGREAARRRVEESFWGRTAGLFGTAESVGGVTPDQLRSWAPSYLDPHAMLFVIATSLSPSDLRPMVDRSLGTLPVPQEAYTAALLDTAVEAESFQRRIASTPRSIGSFAEGIRAGARLPELAVVVDSIGAAQAAIQLIQWVGPIKPEDRAAAVVANAILSERIAFQLREKEGLAYSIGSSLSRTEAGNYVWQAGAGTQAASAARIIEGCEAALDSLASNAPSADETKRTVGKLRGSNLMRRSTRINLAYATGLAVLRGEEPQKVEEAERALLSVTPAQAQAAARNYLWKKPTLVVAVR